MTRISYLNGEFLSHENCLIHIEDRGFQFGDGVYEVTLFENNKFIDGDAHIERLFRSLKEFKIEHDFKKEELFEIMSQLFLRNKIEAGTCYLNITRGYHSRIPNCPKGLKPTINATVSPRKKFTKEEFEAGITAITHDDIRWSRCDIKSVLLAPSSMMNQKAKDMGYNDAILVRDGFVTEGSFANVFIVDQNDVLITRNPDNFILQGITRNRLIDLAKKKGIKVEERKFSVEELLSAKEVFLTSSSLLVRPVVKINDVEISGKKIGNIARLLSEEYQAFINS